MPEKRLKLQDGKVPATNGFLKYWDTDGIDVLWPGSHRFIPLKHGGGIKHEDMYSSQTDWKLKGVDLPIIPKNGLSNMISCLSKNSQDGQN